MQANRKDVNTALRGVHLEHRHFAFIAATLKAAKRNAPAEAHQQWLGLVRTFADGCEDSNPRFKRDRFLAACGYF